MTISAQLKKYISECGLSHRQLSLASGVNRRCIGRFIAGEIMLSLEAVDLLAAYFQVMLAPIPDEPERKNKRGVASSTSALMDGLPPSKECNSTKGTEKNKGRDLL